MDSSSDSDDDKEKFYSTLKERLNRSSSQSNGSQVPSPAPIQPHTKSKRSHSNTLSEVISNVINLSVNKENKSLVEKVVEPKLHYFVRLYNVPQKSRRESIPIRIMTMTESKDLYPDLPHSWMCHGRLLRLLDPNHTLNHSIFQVTSKTYSWLMVQLLFDSTYLQPSLAQPWILASPSSSDPSVVVVAGSQLRSATTDTWCTHFPLSWFQLLKETQI